MVFSMLNLVRAVIFLMTVLRQNLLVSCICLTVRSVRVVEGQSAELYCHVNNLPNKPPYYMKSWSRITSSGNRTLLLFAIIRDGNNHRDFEDLFSGYAGRVEKVNDDVIKLLKVTQQDAGQYVCLLDSDIDGCINDNTKFNMSVIVPVSNVKPNVISVKEGDHATFRCMATGTTPIKYTWQKTTGSLPGGGRWQGGSDGSVTLSNVHRSDAGSYTCTADNEANKPVTSDQVYFDVYYAPSKLVLTSSPSDLTHRDNTQVALACSAAGGHPAPDVILYRGTIGVTSGTSQVTHRRRLHKSDNQVAFVCRATSKGISGKMSSNQIIYNVTYPPTVTLQIQKTPITEGGQVTLTCDAAGGNPQNFLLYEWRRTSEFTSDRGELAAKKKITLTEVSYKDAGKYECHVTNAGGTASDEKNLTVLYTAKLDPRIGNHQSEKHSDYGADVTFTLKVIANPQPTFNWTYTNQRGRELLLPKASVTDSFLQSSLTIHKVTVEDFTMYTCVVANSVGQSLFHFKLTIAVAPETPVSFKINYTSVTTVTLSWISSFSGGYPQTFQIVYRKTGDPWPVKPHIQNIADPGEGSEVTYKLTGLHPETSYEFRIKAVNSRSSGQNSSDFTSILNTTTNEMPSVTKFSVLREPQSGKAEALWSVDRGRFTHLVIQICESRCRFHNLTATEAANQKTIITGLEPDKKYTYKLMLYDNGDLIQETRDVNSRTPGNSDVLVASVVSVMLILVLVAVALVVVFLVYRRRRGGKDKSGLMKGQEEGGYHNNAFPNEMTTLNDLNQNPTGPVYAEVDKSKKTSKAKSEQESVLYTDVDKKNKKKPKKENNKNGEAKVEESIVENGNTPSTVSTETQAALYAEIDKSKKKNKKGKQEPEGATYAEIDKSKKKNKKEKSENNKNGEAKMEELNEENENTPSTVSTETQAALYAEIDKSKKKIKKGKQEPAEIDKSKKKNKKEKLGNEKDVNSEVEKKLNTNTQSEPQGALYAEIDKSTKKHKPETPELSGNSAAGGEPGENAYQNRSELSPGSGVNPQLNAEENPPGENAYQNFEELKTGKKETIQMHEKIIGADGTLYEDPRNFDFEGSTKPSQKPKPKLKPRPNPKPAPKVDEPTEYARIDFTRKV